MVNNRLFYTLENREVIPDQQYGFRKNRSTTVVHIILESSIQDAFRKKQHFVIVSLDLAKAYDTCWRRHIVKTLADNKIRGNMLHFIIKQVQEPVEMVGYTDGPYTPAIKIWKRHKQTFNLS
jgi:hypothetical protein